MIIIKLITLIASLVVKLNCAELNLPRRIEGGVGREFKSKVQWFRRHSDKAEVWSLGYGNNYFDDILMLPPGVHFISGDGVTFARLHYKPDLISIPNKSCFYIFHNGINSDNVVKEDICVEEVSRRIIVKEQETVKVVPIFNEFANIELKLVSERAFEMSGPWAFIDKLHQVRVGKSTNFTCILKSLLLSSYSKAYNALIGSEYWFREIYMEVKSKVIDTDHELKFEFPLVLNDGTCDGVWGIK